MLKRQALRLSLLPDAQQQVLLEKTAGCCRNIRDRARGLWGDPEKVRLVASTDLLVAAQAKPKRSFRKKPAQDIKTTGGLPAQACHGRGLCHAQGRKRVAATQPSVHPVGARSPVLQGRE